MKIRVGIATIKRAIKEYEDGDHVVTKCCPVHQALRAHITSPFRVMYCDGFTSGRRVRDFDFTPSLPDELRAPQGWRRAIERIREHGPYLFEFTWRKDG